MRTRGIATSIGTSMGPDLSAIPQRRRSNAPRKDTVPTPPLKRQAIPARERPYTCRECGSQLARMSAWVGCLFRCNVDIMPWTSTALTGKASCRRRSLMTRSNYHSPCSMGWQKDFRRLRHGRTANGKQVAVMDEVGAVGITKIRAVAALL